MAREKKATSETEPKSAWARLMDRLSLPGFESWSTTVRTLVINLFFLLIVLILVPLLVGQFRRDQVIIEPIGVPGALAERGMTAEVAASRIWDGLRDISQAAKTTKETIAALPDQRRVEFSFPDSGLSIESLVYHVRKLFNAYETRIAGEFVCTDSTCAASATRLRLRVIRDNVELIDLTPIGERSERDYFADAASGVLAVLDPFVAISANAETQPLKATVLARRMIRAHHPDAKWAHNLIGRIRIDQKDYPAAIGEFRAALALDPAFRPARNNLANSLLSTGDIAGARKEFTEVRRLDPNDVIAAEGFADLALAENKPDEAVRLLEAAAELDPVNPRYFTRAGTILLEHRQADAGVALLKKALELDPGYPGAFAQLAAIPLVAGDFVAAERIYRDAAEYAPDDATAVSSHGRILAILKDWEAAEARYARAVALAPTDASYRLEHARMLQRLGRQRDALAELERALALAPDNADVWMSIADSQRDLGNKTDAIAAYKKFLEIAPTDAPMRPVAEQFIKLLSG
jgi:tetratricopeptide (TPR) repeat protein